MSAQAIAEQNNRRAEIFERDHLIIRQHNAIQTALDYLQRGQMIDVSKAVEILKQVQG